MVTVYVPPPSASEVMDMMARWVARLYGVKVTVKIESHMGESNTVIDGRPAPLDVCTDPDNCKRCKAPAWEKHRHEHAGLTARYSGAGNGQIADPAGTACLGA